jgi:hypothetical protein
VGRTFFVGTASRGGRDSSAFSSDLPGKLCETCLSGRQFSHPMGGFAVTGQAVGLTGAQSGDSLTNR